LETPLTLTLHVAQIGSTLMVLGVVLNQHKVWIRVKDRLNTLWAKHCKETGDKFVSLDGNGH
jgi:hypothetical protein